MKPSNRAPRGLSGSGITYSRQLDAEHRISGAIVGFRISMLEIPTIYRKLETAIREGATDEDLRRIVAAHRGVTVAP